VTEPTDRTERADKEWEVIQSAIARLRASVMAVVFGMLGGAGLFGATAWLLVRGGLQVGEHLSLLGNYFPGYSVTWSGAFVGFFYGALAGGLAGWSLAWLYNMFANLRDQTR
jgi:hypothetical protein